MSSSASSSSASPEPPQIQKLKRKRKDIVQDKVEDDQSEASDAADDEVLSPGENEPEEPVLSHAERRRKKKEEKLASKLKAQEGSATKKRKLKDGTAQDAGAKRQNSVWVGNMSFKTTQENLRTFFADVGEITRVNMPTKLPAAPGLKPENRGFAYVDFATPEAKHIAIALSENPLLGRKLLIKDGDSFEGRPAAVTIEGGITDPAIAHQTHSKTAQKILRAQKQPPAPTLFVGNLGFETTEASIRELLEAHRPIKKKAKDAAPEEEEKKVKDVWIRKVRMGTFEDSGLCKGFAFVDFMTIEHATSALINPKNHHLNGRTLVMEYASPDAVRRGAPKTKTDGAASNGRRPFPTNNRSSTYSRPNSSYQPREMPETQEAVEVPAEESEEKKVHHGKERTPRGDRKELEGVRHKGPKTRPKPGAALALAKRESAAIIPSQGQKITF
ncbi:hypothetical protein B0H34DRAFT_794092 [Crassisporium funariophilum]|nr:hypothetical protein B0H34DRAFT_794092 [Crassisporium funariophilum]